jgi:hypothetical protein
VENSGGGTWGSVREYMLYSSRMDPEWGGVCRLNDSGELQTLHDKEVL